MLWLLVQVLSVEHQLCVVTGQQPPSTSSQHDLPASLSDLAHDLVTLPRPLTSVPTVDGLSDLSSESEHSSPGKS